jgi:hypothetical protein
LSIGLKRSPREGPTAHLLTCILNQYLSSPASYWQRLAKGLLANIIHQTNKKGRLQKKAAFPSTA